MGQEVSDMADGKIQEGPDRGVEVVKSKDRVPTIVKSGTSIKEKTSALSTDCSNATPTRYSKSPKKPAQWAKAFIRIKHQGPRDVQLFVPRTSKNLRGDPLNHSPYLLSEVDTRSGKPECITNTRKQWDAMRVSNKGTLPIELRAARLYMFGNQLQWEERVAVKKKDWRNLEVALAKQIQDLPVPLEEYARARNETIRTRPRRLSNHHEVRSPTSQTSMDVNRAGTETYRPKPVFTGNDFSFMDRAAQETMNGSEYVKGVGIVPINRYYPKTVESQSEPIQESLNLSPENYACQDRNFPVCQVLTLGAIVDSDNVEENTVENPQHFTLSWRGKSGQVITILKNSVEILSLAFEDITSCHYNIQQKKILFSVPGNEILVTMTDKKSDEWMILKHCCYKLLEARSGMHINKESNEFFMQKTKFLSLTPKKNVLFPQFAKRGNPGAGPKRKPSQGPLKHQKSLLGHLLKNDYTPTKRRKLFGLEGSEKSHARKDQSHANMSETDSSVEKETNQVRRRIPLQHQVKMTSKTPEGLYYDGKYTLESSFPLAISLNDRVVRVRTKRNRETGKRDCYDIFDGPWSIKKFDTADNIHGLEEDSENGDSPRTVEHKWERMLKTKVILNFPNKSAATKWVEIGQLIPLVDIRNMLSGAVFDSCLAVAQLPEFQLLKVKMKAKEICEATELDSHDIDRTHVVSNDEIGEQDEMMFLAQVKKEQFVAVIEVASQAIDDGDSYEVEKLRAKRIRLYEPENPEVKEFGLKTDYDDPWVQRIKKDAPELAQGCIAVSEYLVHWAGWPNEDDTWTLGTNNIPAEFIKEFNMLTDPLRGVPLGQPVENPESLIFAGDLVSGIKARKSMHRKRSSARRSSGGKSKDEKRKGAQRVSALAESTDIDTLVVDSGDEDLAKAIQESMEAVQTKRLFEEHQKDLGVTKNGKKKIADDKYEDMGNMIEDERFLFEGGDADMEGPRVGVKAANAHMETLTENDITLQSSSKDLGVSSKDAALEDEERHAGEQQQDRGAISKNKKFQAYVRDENDENTAMVL